MHHITKKQAEDRRLAAIEAEDDLDYARAFYSQDIIKMKVATEIEDIIFDYFGIMEIQFEASNNFFKKDVTFQQEKIRIQREVKETVDEEYGLDDTEHLSKLTKKQSERHMERIRTFTADVVAKFTTIDPRTGQKMISMNDRRFEIMHQQAKDKFYLDTGYTPEQISK